MRNTKSDCCNINPGFILLKRHRKKLKDTVLNDHENPHLDAYEQLKQDEKVNKIVDAFIDSSDGRIKSAKIKSRIKNELAENDVKVDGLPSYCRIIDGYIFYNEQLNSNLKYNKFYCHQSPLIMSYLEKIREFSYVKGSKTQIYCKVLKRFV